MKNLVMKSTTILFACLCFTALQRIEAKCCGKDNQSKEQSNQGKEQKEGSTVIERIKNKISKMLHKNTGEEAQNATNENEESSECASCPATNQPCSASCDNADKKDMMITAEIEINIDQQDSLESLSASEVIEMVSEVIAEEIEEANANNEEEIDFV